MRRKKFIRYILIAVLAIVALNAFGGGYYGLAGAENVPIEWLEDSPFNSYFIPSLILLIGVGGSCLIACIAFAGGAAWAHYTGYASGLILLTWITVQVSIIGYVSWLQPTMFITALSILFLTRILARQRVLQKK